MVVSKCVYLTKSSVTKSSVFVYDYGSLCTVVCVVPRNLLGKCICMCYMWSLILVLSPKNITNTFRFSRVPRVLYQVNFFKSSHLI